MGRLKELCGNFASALQRKFLGRGNGSHYGDLAWVVRPELATSIPRRAWREELDRIAVTTLGDQAPGLPWALDARRDEKPSFNALLESAPVPSPGH